MKFKIISLVIFIFCIKSAYCHEIALTFDDLIGVQNKPTDNIVEINDRLLKALHKFKAPAIGFVNESTIDNINRIAILQSWINSGHILGNHTFSHFHLSHTNLKEFEDDVIKGGIISKELMTKAGMKYQYFRHPYLDAGSTPEIRNNFEKFLKDNNYIIAPVTIDTDDWKFNKELSDHPENKEQIIQKYLEYTKAKFDFYQKVSNKIFIRKFPIKCLIAILNIFGYCMII